MRIVLVGGQLFLQSEAFGLPAETPWVAVVPGGTDPVSQAVGPTLDELTRNAHPSQNLGILAGATALTVGGTETVDGVETTRYDATIDLAQAREQLSDSTAANADQLLAAGVTTVDTSVWVGADDLLRRFTMSMAVGSQRIESTASYRQWGEPVRSPRRRPTRSSTPRSCSSGSAASACETAGSSAAPRGPHRPRRGTGRRRTGRARSGPRAAAAGRRPASSSPAPATPTTTA